MKRYKMRVPLYLYFEATAESAEGAKDLVGATLTACYAVGDSLERAHLYNLTRAHLRPLTDKLRDFSNIEVVDAEDVAPVVLHASGEIAEWVNPQAVNPQADTPKSPWLELGIGHATIADRIEHLRALRQPGPVDLGPEDNLCAQVDLFRELHDLENMNARNPRAAYCTYIPGEFLYDGHGPLVDIVTCGTCGRSWNDAIITSLTPVPSARCPFEDLHEDEEPEFRYSYDGRRTILRDGKPFFWLERAADVRSTHVDLAAREIARLFNEASEDPCGPEAIKRYMEE